MSNLYLIHTKQNRLRDDFDGVDWLDVLSNISGVIALMASFGAILFAVCAVIWAF